MPEDLDAISETIMQSIEQARKLENPLLIFLLQMASLELAEMEDRKPSERLIN